MVSMRGWGRDGTALLMASPEEDDEVAKLGDEGS